MAVVSCTEFGFVLDQTKFIEKSFKSTVVPSEYLPQFLALVSSRVKNAMPSQLSSDSNSTNSSEISSSHRLRYKKELFAIQNPFLMDSEFEALLRRLACKPSDQTDSSIKFSTAKSPENAKKRKRKNNKEKEKEESSDDKTEENDLCTKFAEILNRSAELWLPVGSISEMNNNLASRAIAKVFANTPMFLEQKKFFENSSDLAKIAVFGNELYAIPPKCRFISSDFRDMDCFLQNDLKYDLVVMDPPWENKSAKRLKTYDFLTDADFIKIPIQKFVADGAIVALWITNNKKLKNFVENSLFPAWNLQKEAEWIWVKVTQSGQPVFPFHSRHKKPFEKLILARFGKRKAEKSIPKNLVFVSIPSAIHSHKPSLSEVLLPFLPLNENRCLELFARSLTTGWTSWGLEVLKLQNLNLFERNF